MGKVLDEILKDTITFYDSNKNEIALNAHATRRQYAPDATDSEWEQFVDTIEANGLDPRRKEVYFLKYKSRDGGAKVAVVTGYQVYIARALASGKLKKLSSPRVIKPEENDVDTWYGVIDIWRTDMSEMETWKTPMREVNKHQALWEKMPEFMLGKNTATQCLRFHLADVLGGLPYIAEEITSTESEIETQGIPQETKIEPSTDEAEKKAMAKVEALKSYQKKADGCETLEALESWYTKIKATPKYPTSELKNDIDRMYHNRRYDLTTLKLEALTGISVFDIREFMNEDVDASSIVAEAIAGNVDAIKQFKDNISSYLDSVSSAELEKNITDPDNMELNI